MEYLAIMGITGSGKSTLEEKMTKLGYKKNISFTTRPKEPNEKDLEDYIFLDNRDKFMELVNDGTIIEYVEYAGNLYGTQRPFGSTKFVSVCEVNGAKELKNIYGDQVKIIYLKVSQLEAYRRVVERQQSGRNTNNISKRAIEDTSRLEEMERCADIILDASINSDSQAKKLLEILKSKETY